MNINLIGVPLYYGCDIEGVELGPDTLRKSGIKSILENDKNKVYDMGNIYIPFLDKKDKYKYHDNMQYLNPIVEANNNLAHAVYSALNSGSFPIVLGGDHSLGVGSISGASKYHENIAVIWVDAHGDINDHITSPSGRIHGMPLAAAMGIGHSSLTNIYYEGQKVRPENVYIIGARDLDPGEIKLINNSKINLYEMKDIKKNSLQSVLNHMIEKIKMSNIDGIHLSFDIDCLDPSIVPGTGTPVKNGLTLDEGKFILKEIFNSRLVTSMDFVEFNPKIDSIDNKTLDTCLDLISFFSKLI